MNPLMIKLLGIGLVLASAFALGWKINGDRWEVKYLRLDSQYQSFSAGVAALGEKAKTRNAVVELNNLKNKERADEENRRTTAGLRADVKRLRDERDYARGSIVPAAPAGSASPDVTCADRAELERALREFVTETRGLMDEGSAAVTDLNTAKQWAQSPRSE